MKLTKKIFALVAVLMMTANVLAGEVTVITMLNGVANSNVGTVTDNVANGVCTLTVKPASGYYIDIITAEKIVDAGMAQAPRRRTTPGMDNYLQVSGPQSPFDPSGETTWTFTMPTDENYDVEVIANFKARTSISGATITLAATEVTYNGDEQTPAVTKVVLSGKELAESDYEVGYSNNIDAGTNATVTVTGKNTYTGTATTTFTIKKAALSNLSVMMEGWTYGEYNEEVNAPRVDGNEGEGQETVSYKVKGAGDDTYTTEVPSDAGTYVVKVAVAATDNFAAGSATAEFTIARADLNLNLTLQGWSYGNAANTPSLSGNDGNGAVTYTYAIDNASAEYTTTVPTNAGSYKIKAAVAVTTNYNAAEATDTFKIAKANLSGVTIADIADQTYNNGSAIEPTVNVTFKNEAVATTEYTVSYSNNTSVGEATVTLTATGVNFTAGTTATKTFQIREANAVITATDQTVTYNGEAQTFTNCSVTNGSVIVRYYESEADRAKGSNALEVVVNAGTYYVKVEQGNENYHSDPVNALFVINPKALTEDMMWQEGDEFVYTGQPQTLADTMFGLTDGEDELEYDVDFTIEYTDNINVGTATATITGKGNYTGTLTTTFEIVREVAISFSENNSWMSYYAEENLEIPHELKAYAVTGVDGTTVEVQQLSFIPRHQGVLLTYKEVMPQEESLFFHACDDVPEVMPENMLNGVAAATQVSTLAADGESIYVLYNDEFVKTVSGTIKANRCYLPVDMNVNVNSRLSIIIDDTGIENVMNSKMTVGSYYDLQGRKVAQPAKGLYIVNGRKVVVK